MSLGSLAAIGIVVAFTALLFVGLQTLSQGVLAAMEREALEAGRVLGLARVVMTRQEAEEKLALEPGVVLSDPVVLEGSMRGVRVRIGAFARASNTAVNGARIPGVTTHVQALLARPFGVEVRIGRRVFGMPRSDVQLGGRVDERCWIQTEHPEVVRARLASSALQERVVELVLEGQGSAFVLGTHVETVVFHRSAERIRHAARACAALALELDAVARPPGA